MAEKAAPEAESPLIRMMTSSSSARTFPAKALSFFYISIFLVIYCGINVNSYSLSKTSTNRLGGLSGLRFSHVLSAVSNEQKATADKNKSVQIEKTAQKNIISKILKSPSSAIKKETNNKSVKVTPGKVIPLGNNHSENSKIKNANKNKAVEGMEFVDGLQVKKIR